jgi:hypothetical protein
MAVAPRVKALKCKKTPGFATSTAETGGMEAWLENAESMPMRGAASPLWTSRAVKKTSHIVKKAKGFPAEIAEVLRQWQDQAALAVVQSMPANCFAVNSASGSVGRCRPATGGRAVVREGQAGRTWVCRADRGILESRASGLSGVGQRSCQRGLPSRAGK